VVFMDERSRRARLCFHLDRFQPHTKIKKVGDV